jgi:hypothetical protein
MLLVFFGRHKFVVVVFSIAILGSLSPNSSVDSSFST